MTDEATAQAAVEPPAPFRGRSTPLLRERGRTHGSFKENARLSQAFKKLAHSATGWERLTDAQREVFDQSATKWSRILSGKGDERQHWEDLVGYPQLIVEDTP
jgi:hypothetical protein